MSNPMVVEIPVISPKKVIGAGSEPEVTVAADAPKKVRLRKDTGSGHPSQFTEEDRAWATSMKLDFQWNTDTVKGMPEPRYEMDAQGWESVTPDMWNGRFDGRWAHRGHKGEIILGSMVLQWRPLELTMEAREEDAQKAGHPIKVTERQLKEGNIPGITMDTQHKSARANTGINKEYMPSSIPVPD